MNIALSVGRIIASLVVVGGLILSYPRFVGYAESPAQITILDVDTSQFPEMSIYFAAADSAGAVTPDLSSAQLQVIENGKPLQPRRLAIEDPGIRLTVAFNPGPGMALYAGGATRFNSIRKSLLESATSLSAPFDDYSLITSNGILTARDSNIKQWASLLEQFSPNLAKPAAGFNSFTQALDLTAGTNPRPHMQQVILWITPMLSAEQLKLTPGVSQRAGELGVRVHIWLVGPSFAGNSTETQSLRTLAEATGGSLFIFSGVEKLPELSSYLEPLRGVYRLDYTSRINESGDHSIAILHTEEEETTSSAEFPLELTVLPPNPVLLSLPGAITRVETRVSDQNKYLLIPLNQPILVAVEFPDGHERKLAASRLFVNGELVQENRMEPFNQFTWDLTPYEESGSHTLRVEVTDTLGLSRSTISTPVELEVQYRPSLLAPANLDRLSILFVILLATAALVMILIFLSRRGWGSETRRRKRKEDQDPVTQPVNIHQEATLLRRQNTPGQGSNIKTISSPRLVLQGEGSPAVIPLEVDELTLGSDRRQAQIWLDSPSIDPLHARINLDESGAVIISDLGSVAGTWVNYTPISSTGVRLEDGDLVRIGKMSFRFQVAQAEKPRGEF
jgi:pSer/pThr/pTyr-binding forkhead associated (FHA) protein